MQLNRKDILGLQDMSCEDIKLILDTAVSTKEIISRPIKKVPILRGKSVCTLFYENSTRTKTSFEVAAKMMSADTTGISVAGSSINKGESFKDTLLTLEAMGIDLFIIRHGATGSAHFAAQIVKAHVINAGDGTHEHPTQGLLDMFSIIDVRGGIEGLKVLILGDIMHSRVARSNIWGLSKMGAEVRVCAPATLLPAQIEKMPCKVYYNLDEAVKDVDVINVLRLQLERMDKGFFPSLREYYNLYGVTEERLDYAKEDVTIMHPGPMNRGVEISSEVADSGRAIIVDQVTNGLAVRMAILYLMLGGGGLSVASI